MNALARVYLLVGLLLVCPYNAFSQTTGNITTVVGTGTAGFSGDGNAAISAQIDNPYGVFIDAAGNQYIADASNNVIRKVSPAGIITTVAGTGTAGFTGDLGQATAAQLSFPTTVQVDASGQIFIADKDNNRVRRVGTDGIITTVAGGGAGGDGGQATAASLNAPWGIFVDDQGVLFISEQFGNRIRRVGTDGIITTVAGGGGGGDGGQATAASLNGPLGIFIDVDDNLYITEWLGHRVRKVNSSGIISTIAGTGANGFSGDGGQAVSAQVNEPSGVWVHSGIVYIVDQNNHRIRTIDLNGDIDTIIGSGASGGGNGSFSGDGGPATSATLNQPHGMAIDGQGAVYIADSQNNRIRKAFGVAQPLFTDVSATANVDNNGSSRGVAWGDYNGDGMVDLYVTDTAGANQLYRNNGNGTFTNVAGNPGVDVDDASVSIGAAWGDYDNDGDLDLFVANADAANRLYRNEGNGAFTDVASSALVDNIVSDSGVAWGDYNNDGWLDISVARSGSANANQLFHNNGDGTFSNVANSAGVDVPTSDSQSGIWGDYDNDGDLDLYIPNAETNVSSENRLYRNDGANGFSDQSVAAGVNDARFSSGAAWGDYDNDGDLDLFVTNILANGLFQNDGNGNFTDVAGPSGLEAAGPRNSRGLALGDYDNDGDLDLFLNNEGTPNQFFLNNGDGSFTDIINGMGINTGGEGQGTAFADFDNDGDLDLYVGNNGSENRLYENAGNTNRWLAVSLTGRISNRNAIGARLEAWISGTRLRRDLEGSSGLFSQPSLPVEFGLGISTTLDSLIIRWPSGIKQVLTNVASNQKLTVLEPIDPVTVALGMDFGAAGDTLCVPVTLTNPNTLPVGGLQFDVINSDTTAAKFKALADTSAHPGFSFNTNTFGDTTRVVVHSASGAVIQPGTDLAILTLKYCLTGNAALGSTINLTLTAVEIGDSSGVAFPDSALSGTLNVGIRGDVNLDGRVSILDVIKLVRILVGKDATPAAGTTAFKIADADANGTVTITDVVTQINNILGIQPKVVASAPAGPAAVTLGLPQTGPDGVLAVPVHLTQGGLLAGMQMSFSYDPTKMSLEAPVIGSRQEGLLMDSHIEDGVLRLIIYTMQPGRGITTGNDPLVWIPVGALSDQAAGRLTLTDITLVDASAQHMPVTLDVPSVAVGKEGGMPTVFSLSPARPNPFNPRTTIAYEVPQQAHVTLTVYNLLGQQVVRLVDSVKLPGRYEVVWNAVNAKGQSVASGVYMYRITTDAGFVQNRRMTLLK